MQSEYFYIQTNLVCTRDANISQVNFTELSRELLQFIWWNYSIRTITHKVDPNIPILVLLGTDRSFWELARVPFCDMLKHQKKMLGSTFFLEGMHRFQGISYLIPINFHVVNYYGKLTLYLKHS